jgi:hypothetical protein
MNTECEKEDLFEEYNFILYFAVTGVFSFVKVMLTIPPARPFNTH